MKRNPENPINISHRSLKKVIMMSALGMRSREKLSIHLNSYPHSCFYVVFIIAHHAQQTSYKHRLFFVRIFSWPILIKTRLILFIFRKFCGLVVVGSSLLCFFRSIVDACLLFCFFLRGRCGALLSFSRYN
jgi:hypothetical protein